MKALTLTQPWATLVAVGSKRIETRSWRTPYRGPLAIHAAKGFTFEHLIYHAACWNICGALRPIGKRMGDNQDLRHLLPFGAIVAVADVVDVMPTESFTVGELDTPRMPEGETLESYYRWTERQLGDFTPGRYGWRLADVRQLETPIPCRGALGLWTVPAEISARVESQ